MSLADKISKRTFPTKDIVLCMDSALSAERDAAIVDLAAARKSGEGRLASSPTATLTKRIAELEEQMRDSLVTVRVVGMPFQAYNKIMAAHPPRKGKQEAYNVETFFPDVVYKAGSLVEGDQVTPLSDTPRGEWDSLVEVLTDKEFDALVEAVIATNRTMQEVGFLARGSATTPDSSETSDSLDLSD
jgi:hypothetical protein